MLKFASISTVGKGNSSTNFVDSGDDFPQSFSEDSERWMCCFQKTSDLPLIPGSQARPLQEYLPLKLLIINQLKLKQWTLYLYNGLQRLPDTVMPLSHGFRRPGLQGEYSISGHLPFAFGKHFFFLAASVQGPSCFGDKLLGFLWAKLRRRTCCV